MDQGNPADAGDMLALPPRAWLTPLRTALLVLGAVLGAVVLSLLLGASPARAAENPGPDDPGAPVAGELPLRVLTPAVASVAHQAVPRAQHALELAGGTLVSAVPVAAPAVTPVVTGLDAALALAHDSVAPVVDGALLLVSRDPASLVGGAALFSMPALVAESASVLAPVLATPSTGGPGAATGAFGGAEPGAPSPLLTSSSAAGAAALCILFLALIAPALSGSRTRRRDDALPASPVFDTDTSPA